MKRSKFANFIITVYLCFILLLSVLSAGVSSTTSPSKITIALADDNAEIPDAFTIDANNLDLVNPDMSDDNSPSISKGVTLETASLAPDADGDGLKDEDESQIYYTDPLNPDTDGDGLTDGVEVWGWNIEITGEIQHVTSDPTEVDTDNDGLTDYEEASYKEGFPIHATGCQILQGLLYCGDLADTYAKDPSFPAVQGSGTEGILGLLGLVTEVDYTFVIPSTVSVAEISQFSVSVAAVARQGSSAHDTAWSVQLQDLSGTWQEIRSISDTPGTWVLDWTYFTPSNEDVNGYLSDQDRVLHLKLIAGHQMEFIRYLDFLELTLYSLSSHLTDPRNSDTDDDGLLDGFEVGGWDIEVNGEPQHVTADPTKFDTDQDGLSDYEEAPTTVDFPIHATERQILQGLLYCGDLADTYAKDPSFPAVQGPGTEGILGLLGLVTEVDYTFVVPSTVSVAEISQFSVSVAAVARQGSSPHDTAWSVQLQDLSDTWQEIRSISDTPGTWVLDWTYFTPSNEDVNGYLSDQDRVLHLKLIAGHQMEFIRYLDFLELTLYIIIGGSTDPRNPDTDDDGLSDYEEVTYNDGFPIHATERQINEGMLYCGDLADLHEKTPTFPAIDETGTEEILGLLGQVTEADYAFVLPPEIVLSEISQFSISVAAVALDGGEPHDTAWSVQLQDLSGTWQEIHSIPEAPGTWVLDWTYSTSSQFDVATYLSDQDRLLHLKLISGTEQMFVRYLDFLELTLYNISEKLTDPQDSDTDDDGLLDGIEVEGWDIKVNGETRHVTADPTEVDTDQDGLSDYEEAPIVVGFPIHATERQINEGMLYCGDLADLHEKTPTFPAIDETGTEGILGLLGQVTEADYTFVLPPEIVLSEISQFSISVAAVALDGGEPHDTAWSVQLQDLSGTWQEIYSIPKAPGAWVLDWTYFVSSTEDVDTYLSDQDRLLHLKLMVGSEQMFVRYLDFLELTLYNIVGSLTDPRDPDTDDDGISDYDEYFDTTPPIVSLSINDDALYTDSWSVSLTITATDNSGLAQMRFKNAGEEDWTAWEPFAPTKSWLLPTGDGPKIVFVQVSDVVGNIGEGSDTILLQTVLADAGADQVVFEGATVQFDGSASHGSQASLETYYEIIYYGWDIDGDDSDDLFGPTPSYIFDDNCEIDVKLMIIDEQGFTTSDMMHLTVSNVAPTVTIDSVEQTQPFTLDELTVLMLDPTFFTGSATDPGSDDLTFQWEWGDGTSATITTYPNEMIPVVITETVEHAFAEPGDYIVSLTVEDDDGGSTTATVLLTVWGPRNLKMDVISELEALKTGERCLDWRLGQIIRYIECSLNEKFWADATHLASQYGYCVFLYELFAEIHLQIRNELYSHLIPVLEKWIERLKAKDYDTTWLEEKLARLQAFLPVFEAALYKTAKADELLARVAILDAENTPVQTPYWQPKVERLLTKAHEHMLKAADHVENGQFIAAICHYKVAWKFAQEAMKWAIKEYTC